MKSLLSWKKQLSFNCMINLIAILHSLKIVHLWRTKFWIFLIMMYTGVNRSLEDFTYGDRAMYEVMMESMQEIEFIGLRGYTKFDTSGNPSGLLVISQQRGGFSCFGVTLSLWKNAFKFKRCITKVCFLLCLSHQYIVWQWCWCGNTFLGSPIEASQFSCLVLKETDWSNMLSRDFNISCLVW